MSPPPPPPRPPHQVTGNKPATGTAWPGDLPDERRQSSSPNPIFQGDLNIALAAEARMPFLSLLDLQFTNQGKSVLAWERIMYFV